MAAQELRRLLELAAKAIGGRITQWDGGTIFHPKAGHGFDWNPIDDDGDALRLAVAVGINMHVDPLDEEGNPVTVAKAFGLTACIERHHSDPCAATRLAIVRAAAAIGEKMEEEK